MAATSYHHHRSYPCAPSWIAQDECPHGSQLWGDVTMPDSTTVNRYLLALALIYSYLPYLVCFVSVIFTLSRFIIKHTSTGYFHQHVVFTGFGILVVGMGELVWKNIIAQPRPEGSCLTSCGMPSSHSTIAIGYFTWMLLEGLKPTNQGYAASLFEKIDTYLRNWMEARWIPERIKLDYSHNITNFKGRIGRGAIALPINETPRGLSSSFAFIWILFWAIIWVPVPFSRVWLRDHSWTQVGAGSLLGVIEGMLYYALVNELSWRSFEPRFTWTPNYVGLLFSESCISEEDLTKILENSPEIAQQLENKAKESKSKRIDEVLNIVVAKKNKELGKNRNLTVRDVKRDLLDFVQGVDETTPILNDEDRGDETKLNEIFLQCTSKTWNESLALYLNSQKVSVVHTISKVAKSPPFILPEDWRKKIPLPVPRTPTSPIKVEQEHDENSH